MPTDIASTPQNWSRSHRTLSWAFNTSTVRALQRATRTVPIVFASSIDPVGSGIVESLARPGGNCHREAIE